MYIIKCLTTHCIIRAVIPEKNLGAGEGQVKGQEGSH